MIAHIQIMENIRQNNVLAETFLNIIAIILTVGEVVLRGMVFLLTKSVSLLCQLLCILVFTAVIILTYLIVMAVSGTIGPWLNTHLH